MKLRLVVDEKNYGSQDPRKLVPVTLVYAILSVTLVPYKFEILSVVPIPAVLQDLKVENQKLNFERFIGKPKENLNFRSKFLNFRCKFLN
jgi:hypothetical protein